MHDEFTALMSAVLDHEAPPGDAVRLHEHLQRCPACAQVWATWRSMDAFLAAAPRLAAPPNFVLLVAARLEERRQRQQRRRGLGSGLLVAWAALIGVFWLAVLGFTVWGFAHPGSLAIWAANGAETVGGVVEIMRGLQAALMNVGFLPISLGLGFYLCVTGLLAVAWLWLMVRKSAWAQVVSAANEPLAE